MINYRSICAIAAFGLLTIAGGWTQVIAPPVIQGISVINESGDVRIDWQKSPDPLTEGYIIYLYVGDFQGINTIQISVVDDETTHYTVSGTETGNEGVAYVIAAFMIDGSDTIRSALTQPHRTIFLNVEWNPCVVISTLKWTDYEGWDENLLAYQWLWYLRGQTDTTAGPILNPLSNEGTHTSPPFNEDVCYLVRAFHMDGYESFSNRVCMTTSVKVPPAWINATNASVSGENLIELIFHPDPDAQTDKYILYRSEGMNGPFVQVSLLNQYPPALINFTDNGISTQKINYYKLIALNECNLEVTESNLASNIVLKTTEQNGLVSMDWNNYESWAGEIDRYEVFRVVDNELPQLTATLPGILTSFTEDLSGFRQAELSGVFCYDIRAYEGSTNPYGFRGESKSNRACVTLEPEIFIPDAFTPDGDGRNDLFRVFFTFSPARYHMIIYDRWRNAVFESRDPQTHWDGTLSKGKKAPEGIYTYLLMVETQGGKQVRKTGQLALIYP